MTIMRRRRRSPKLTPLQPHLLFCIWLLTHTLTATKRIACPQHIRSGVVVEAKKPIPQSRHQSFLYSTSPPWNPSPHIDEQGFLSSTYICIPGTWEKEARIGGKYGYKSKYTRRLAAEEHEVYIRQVPGDGNCLFHSLAVALCWVEDGIHLDFDENSTNPKYPRRLISLGRRQKKGTLNMNEIDGLGFDNENPSAKKRNKRNDRQMDLDDTVDIFTRSAILRQLSVEMLRPSSTTSKSYTQKMQDKDLKKTARRKRERPLFLQGSEFLRPKDLLHVASSQYGISGKDYCEQMMNDGVWGGGPEIVGLCNWLKRPIHVYELISVKPKAKRMKRSFHLLNNRESTYHRGGDEYEEGERENEDNNVKPEFRLRRMACFGSPKFDYREPLHILSADCRFPDLTPGHQAPTGNHFMALYPKQIPRAYHSRERRRKRQNPAIESMQSSVRVRSGGDVATQKDVGIQRHKRRRRNKTTENISSWKEANSRGLEDGTSLFDRIIDFATRRTNAKALPDESEDMNPSPIKVLKRWYCDWLSKEK